MSCCIFTHEIILQKKSKINFYILLKLLQYYLLFIIFFIKLLLCEYSVITKIFFTFFFIYARIKLPKSFKTIM